MKKARHETRLLDESKEEHQSHSHKHKDKDLKKKRFLDNSKSIKNFEESSHKVPEYLVKAGNANWKFIHIQAAYYPEKPTEEDKYWSKVQVEAMARNMRCDTCKLDFLNIIFNKRPIKNNNRDEYFRWTVDAHNDVNEKIGKPKFSYEDAYKEYLSSPTDNHYCPLGEKCTAPQNSSGSSSGIDTEGKEKKSLSGSWLWVFIFILFLAIVSLGMFAYIKYNSLCSASIQNSPFAFLSDIA